MRRLRVLAGLACVAGLAACGDSGTITGASSAASPAGTSQATAARAGTARTIVTGLQVPWGVAFLPDGRALVSERTTGRIVEIPKGGGTPKRVMTIDAEQDGGEGGLLGLAVSPSYARDHWVYAYYTTASDNRIVRFKLGGALHPILTGLRRGGIHNGGRIAFGPDGKLYAGVGETGDGDLAQDRGSRNGKILRINPNGSIPAGNPFKGSPVWSYGHRNPQGLAWDSKGRLWAAELGQNTFDEVNVIRRGRNYGWPVIEGVGSTHGGRYTNPVATWSTGDASPSGAAIVGNTMYIGALQGHDLLRLRLDGTRAHKLSPWLKDRFGRIRSVVQAPDGSLWITTSNRDGRGSPGSGDDRIVRVAL
jgi:glucose/arabinose dehydrogenase